MERKNEAEAVNTDNCTRNQYSSKNLNGKTPYEVWTGKAPDLSHLHIFACKVIDFDRKSLTRKLKPRGEKWETTNLSEEYFGNIFYNDELTRNSDEVERNHIEDYVNMPTQPYPNAI